MAGLGQNKIVSKTATNKKVIASLLKFLKTTDIGKRKGIKE